MSRCLAGDRNRIADTPVRHYSHKDEKWDSGQLNSRVLDQEPPIVKIIPTRFPNRNGWVGRKDRMLGVGETANDIVQLAYGQSGARTVYLTTLPQRKYDFISNVNSPDNDAIKEEIKRQFGVVGRVETMETNVLFL